MEQGLSNNNIYYRLIICICTLFTLNSCNTLLFEDELSIILGVQAEIEDYQTFDEWAGVQGDGFILEIYKLSEKTIDAFNQKSLRVLPDKKEKGKHWQKQSWSKIPIDSSFNEVLTLCLNYASNDNEIKNELNKIKKVLIKRGVYYSLYYTPDKDNPQNVQLFILDIQDRKLYAIDQQI